MRSSELLAQIIATEEEIRKLMKAVCDHGDYPSCCLTHEMWKLVDQLRFREITYIENDQIEDAPSPTE